MRHSFLATIAFLFILLACSSETESGVKIVDPDDDCCESSDSLQSDSEPILGCDGQEYGLPDTSQYILPFEVGKVYKTGLTNCSSSYHSSGRPDQYAFDFDMPLNSSFLASRGGTVYSIAENTEFVPSDSLPKTNIVGNYIIIDHGDNTYGIYLHSPDNGIYVEKGDEVKQGDYLGITGKSGLAGYPHLHFIVVKGAPVYPYKGIPISFKNAYPKDVILKSYTQYLAEKY